jgi:hypothetical protein
VRPKLPTANDEYVNLIKFEQFLKKKYEEEEQALNLFNSHPTMAGIFIYIVMIPFY